MGGERIIELNSKDVKLLSKRREVIVKLIENGHISARAGMGIYEETGSQKVIEEERAAYTNPESSPEDSPLVRLYEVFIPTELGPTS